jgi:hypothetical protein
MDTRGCGDFVKTHPLILPNLLGWGPASRDTPPNHFNGFLNILTQKETLRAPSRGRMRKSTRCLLSGTVWRGERKETIKMVGAESKRAADPNLKVGVNEKLSFHSTVTSKYLS